MKLCASLWFAGAVCMSAQTAETLGWRVSQETPCAAVTASTRIAACRLDTAPSGEGAWRKALQSAAQSGVTVVVVPGTTKDLKSADQAATEANVTVALDTAEEPLIRPVQALNAVQAQGPRIRLWANPEAWEKAGTRPLAAIYMLRERLAGGSLQPGAASDEFLKEAYRLDLKPLVWTLPLGDNKRTTNTIESLVSYHAQYASRTAGVRRLAEITPEERAKVEAAIPASAPAVPKKPRKLLVFDLNAGRFGHPSIPYANLAMQLMGKKTGAFEATVTSDPAMLEPSKLRGFDAVYLNNTIGDIFSTAEVRDAFASFVANGGGVIGNHATTVTATEWKEFGNILGGRGASHRMTDEKVLVRVEDPSNPITKVFGSTPFEYSDEIFRFQPPYARDKVRVLLSVDPQKTDMNQGRCFGQCYRDDNDYPVAWIHEYGKGRVFYTTLGHNPYVFWDARMLPFFLAGIQYALGDLEADATPKPKSGFDLDAILGDLGKWDRGQDQAPVRRLERAMGMLGGTATADTEAKLASFLKTGASAAAKNEVCRHLATIGTNASVPALTPLLAKAETADMARYALERIPSPEATAALREALLSAPNVRIQTGIMHSLGRLHDAATVGTFSNLLDSSEPLIAAAAVNGLGMIGNPAAEQALTSVALTPTTAGALLSVAENAPPERALAIYRKLSDTRAPSEVRTAALRGLVRRAGRESVPVLTAALQDSAADVRAAAILGLAEVDAARLAEAFPKLSAGEKIEALNQLAERNNTGALPLFLDATRSDVAEVRAAALLCLAEIGTAAQAPVLVEAASRMKGAEQDAARYALVRIRGSEMDAAIVNAIAKATAPAKIEWIRAAGERGITSAAGVLVSAAADPDAKIRQESIRALRGIAAPENAPALIELLKKADDDDREDAQLALTAAIRRAAQPDLKPVLNAYRGADSPAIKASLLTVMASTSDNSALPSLREALHDNDASVHRAAVNGLAEWTTPDPMEDLLQVARKPPNPAAAVLAVRGYIRLVQLPAGRSPAETAKLLGAAMDVAARPEEKKTVLAALQRLPSPESLRIAKAAESDPAVAAEAKLAVTRLEQSLAARRNQ